MFLGQVPHLFSNSILSEADGTQQACHSFQPIMKSMWRNLKMVSRDKWQTKSVPP